MNRKSKSFRKGIVTRICNNNTAVVSVDNRKNHLKYKKIVSQTINYLVHYEHTPKIKDVVFIANCKPLSKNKSWFIIANKIQEKS
eukprot:COSAG01_NODE_1_length_100484_cov_170.446142_82_plen_85_part_00